MRRLGMLVLLLAATVAFAVAAPPARFCVISNEESKMCMDITEALSTYSSDFEWGCVQKKSVPDCFAAMDAGEVELRVVDGAEMYEGHNFYDLSVVAAEYYEGAPEGKEYHAVAVVDKEVCEKAGDSFRLADLEGMSMCGTGYRRSAGWLVPLGALASEGAIQPPQTTSTNVAPDALAMSQFFDKVCATGLSQEGGPAFTPEGDSTFYQELCEACKDNCTSRDAYSGYEGAFRGLVEGACDVAFTKSAVPLLNTEGGDQQAMEQAEGEWTGKPRNDFRLVCKSGGCKKLEDFEECNLAEVPAHAIVAPSEYAELDALRTTLVDASKDSATAEKMFGADVMDFWAEETASLTPTNGSVGVYLGNMYELYESLYINQWIGVHAQYRPNEAIYCMPYAADNELVEACHEVIALANGNNITFRCIAGQSPDGCLESIANGTADFTTLDTADIYHAETMYGLQPLAAEVYGDDGSAYYAVALVTKETCDAFGEDAKLEDLKGLSSCHTGYGRMAGWTAPIGYLINEGIIPEVDQEENVLNDAEAVAAYFNQTCAPRVAAVGPRITEDGGNALWEQLCDGCTGNCTEADPYSGYRGAVRCLMEEGGDVAFTKHQAVLEYAKDGTEPQDWSKYSKDELRLLCSDGGCKKVGDYKTCNLAEVPAHAVVGRSDWADSAKLKQLIEATNAKDSQFLREARETEMKERYTEELQAAGRDPAQMSGLEGIFEETTTGLQKLDPKKDYLDPVRADIRAIHRLTQPELRWCVHSQEELQFCKDNIDAFNKAQQDAVFTCVTPEDGYCVNMIAQGNADLTVADSHDVYHAWKEFGMKPVMVQNETEGMEEGIEYHAVAVLQADECMPDMTFADLQGKNICSTGYGRTAGWMAPLGYMLYRKVLAFVNTNETVQPDAQSAAAFFGDICAPRVFNNGPKKTEDGVGATWDPLCTACKETCDESDPYFGYDGALRGVMEGSCDVAFTKHSAPLEYAKDGDQAQEWSTLAKDDLRLLCPGSGGCKPVDQWEECSVAAIPAHAVIMKGDSPYIGSVRQALEAAAQDKAVMSAVFDEKANPENMMFEAGTKDLEPVYNVRKYFGQVEHL